jgi:hypothetical protein
VEVFSASVFVAAAAAAAAVVVAIALVTLIVRKAFGSLIVKAGPVSVELQAVKALAETVQTVAAHVETINTAVNHVAAGAPTIRERVETIDRRQEWTIEALHLIAERVEVKLPPVPAAA